MPKKDWTLTADGLQKLLLALDPDHNVAGKRYETLRRQLIFFFESRACRSAEDEADKTLDRVAIRLTEGLIIERLDHYTYGVALNVLREYQRKLPYTCPPPAADDAEEIERRHCCMERCLASLSADTRKMLTEYAGLDRRDGNARKEMAMRLGVSLNALRLRVHHAREELSECMKRCFEECGD